MGRPKKELPLTVKNAPHPHNGTWRLHSWDHAPTPRQWERYTSPCGMKVQVTPKQVLDTTDPRYNYCETCKERPGITTPVEVPFGLTTQPPYQQTTIAWALEGRTNLQGE